MSDEELQKRLDRIEDLHERLDRLHRRLRLIENYLFAGVCVGVLIFFLLVCRF